MRKKKGASHPGAFNRQPEPECLASRRCWPVYFFGGVASLLGAAASVEAAAFFDLWWLLL
jgi:hypothetical protein